MGEVFLPDGLDVLEGVVVDIDGAVVDEAREAGFIGLAPILRVRLRWWVVRHWRGRSGRLCFVFYDEHPFFSP